MATKIWTIELDEADMDALSELADDKFSEVHIDETMDDDEAGEDAPDEEEKELSDMWERITDALAKAKSSDPDYTEEPPPEAA